MPSWPHRGRSPRFVAYAQSVSNTENWYRQTGLAPILSSAVWTAANLAIYTPVILPKPCRPYSVEFWHGAAASGNYDLGIYAPDAEGKPETRLWSSGSKPMVVTESLSGQSPPSTLWIQGLVYLAMSLDNATGQVRRLAALTTNGLGVYGGSIFTETAAFPLPATATPSAVPAVANVPILMLVPRGTL